MIIVIIIFLHRKKKDNFDYCGTHDKNRPHGIVTDIVKDIVNKEKRSLEMKRDTEISGITNQRKRKKYKKIIEIFSTVYYIPDLLSVTIRSGKNITKNI